MTKKIIALALAMISCSAMQNAANAAGDTITLGLPEKKDVPILGDPTLAEPVELDLGVLRFEEAKLPQERLRLGKRRRSGSAGGSSSFSGRSGSRSRRKPTVTPDNLPPAIAELPLEERLALSDLPNYGQPYD